MMRRSKRAAVTCYGCATGIMILGTSLAAAAYPGDFDWMYTVVSALASQKHNPEGARWFAGALCLTMTLLVLAVELLPAGPAFRDRSARFGLHALRVGLVCGALVGFERLLFFHLSDRWTKGHEVLALIAFLALFSGVLALYRSRSRRQRSFRWPARVVVLPLIAIGLNQLALYFDQRDLGWVDANWRERGIPVWFSFAFWQWQAAAVLWLALGHLVITAPGEDAKVPAARASDDARSTVRPPEG